MGSKKTDRRVIRTRKAIHAALLELLIETDYRKITITELARRADIDRKTFYTHYSSINDLLEDIVRTGAEQNLKNVTLRDLMDNPTDTTKRLLNAFDKSLSIKRSDRSKVLKNVPADRLLRTWSIVAKEHIMAQTGPMPQSVEEDIGLLLDFYLGGILNALTRWVSSESNMSFEKAVDLIGNSVVEGLSGIIGKRMALA